MPHLPERGMFDEKYILVHICMKILHIILEVYALTSSYNKQLYLIKFINKIRKDIENIDNFFCLIC